MWNNQTFPKLFSFFLSFPFPCAHTSRKKTSDVPQGYLKFIIVENQYAFLCSKSRASLCETLGYCQQSQVQWKKRHSSQIMNWLESNGKSTRVKKNGRGSKQRRVIEKQESANKSLRLRFSLYNVVMSSYWAFFVTNSFTFSTPAGLAMTFPSGLTSR